VAPWLFILFVLLVSSATESEDAQSGASFKCRGRGGAQSWDSDTFQSGFGVPTTKIIDENTDIVIKLKTSDLVANSNLYIRGLNKPEYQGCSRST